MGVYYYYCYYYYYIGFMGAVLHFRHWLLVIGNNRIGHTTFR